MIVDFDELTLIGSCMIHVAKRTIAVAVPIRVVIVLPLEGLTFRSVVRGGNRSRAANCQVRNVRRAQSRLRVRQTVRCDRRSVTTILSAKDVWDVGRATVIGEDVRGGFRVSVWQLES